MLLFVIYEYWNLVRGLLPHLESINSLDMTAINIDLPPPRPASRVPVHIIPQIVPHQSADNGLRASVRVRPLRHRPSRRCLQPIKQVLVIGLCYEEKSAQHGLPLFFHKYVYADFDSCADSRIAAFVSLAFFFYTVLYSNPQIATVIASQAHPIQGARLGFIAPSIIV